MRKAVAAVVVAAATLAGCGGEDGDGVRILAAASLTESFHAIGDAYGEDVVFSFAGSSALVEQANAGAPADVVVTADERTMDAVGARGEAVVVARNRLAIVVERGNPANIDDLADLARDDVVAVLCAPVVPCGRLAARALAEAGVALDAASLEENVKAVVAKVSLGEADAGIAYVTDVRAADGVEPVAIDVADDPDLQAVYPIAVLDGAADRRAAQRFVDFVAGPDGQAILADHGFVTP